MSDLKFEYMHTECVSLRVNRGQLHITRVEVSIGFDHTEKTCSLQGNNISHPHNRTQQDKHFSYNSNVDIIRHGGYHSHRLPIASLAGECSQQVLINNPPLISLSLTVESRSANILQSWLSSNSFEL